MTIQEPLQTRIDRAAHAINHAGALLICAGAGMGVDSGLPDYRGPEGFWRAYPALGKQRMHLEQISNPMVFDANPRLAWGFFGHQLSLYRRTKPHAGFALLKQWADRMEHGAFVFTSNVDRAFQKSGFREDRVCECHGALHWLQCSKACSPAVWPADRFEPKLDEENCLLLNDMPKCARCGALARPAVLLFDDPRWVNTQTESQWAKLTVWLGNVSRLVIVEIGAGDQVLTVRNFSHQTAQMQRGTLIRINPLLTEVPAGGISVPMTGLAALQAIDAAMKDCPVPDDKPVANDDEHQSWDAVRKFGRTFV